MNFQAEMENIAEIENGSLSESIWCRSSSDESKEKYCCSSPSSSPLGWKPQITTKYDMNSNISGSLSFVI